MTVYDLMVMFAEITENDCVKYRHPMPKGIISPICLVHDNWKTVRYTMSVSILSMNKKSYTGFHLIPKSVFLNDLE